MTVGDLINLLSRFGPEAQFILACAGLSAVISYAWWCKLRGEWKEAERIMDRHDELVDEIVAQRNALQAEVDRLRAEVAPLRQSRDIFLDVVAQRDALRRALRSLLDRGRPIPHAEEYGTAGVSMVVERRAYDAAVAALGGWQEDDGPPASPPPVAAQPTQAASGWHEYGGPWGPTPVGNPLRHRADAEDDWGGPVVPIASVASQQIPPPRRPGVP